MQEVGFSFLTSHGAVQLLGADRSRGILPAANAVQFGLLHRDIFNVSLDARSRCAFRTNNPPVEMGSASILRHSRCSHSVRSCYVLVMLDLNGHDPQPILKPYAPCTSLDVGLRSYQSQTFHRMLPYNVWSKLLLSSK